MYTAYDACEALRLSLLGSLATSKHISTSYVGLGQVAWDDGCGTLVVTPVRQFRYVSFPSELTGAEFCDGGLLGLEVLVTLLRCVPEPDNMGRPPTAKQLADAHQGILSDAAKIWVALACDDLPDEEWERAQLRQSFNGGLGAVIAVETRFLLGLGCSCWNLS